MHTFFRWKPVLGQELHQGIQISLYQPLVADPHQRGGSDPWLWVLDPGLVILNLFFHCLVFFFYDICSDLCLLTQSPLYRDWSISPVTPRHVLPSSVILQWWAADALVGSHRLFGMFCFLASIHCDDRNSVLLWVYWLLVFDNKVVLQKYK